MSAAVFSTPKLRSHPWATASFSRSMIVLALIASLLGLLMPGQVLAQRIDDSQGAVVRAILFYSPTCPHCHEVIQNDLPPLMAKYGEQLQIIGIDVSQDSGQALYQNAITAFGITEDRRGVPCLIVGDVVMVGSGEIPAMFPGLIEKLLAEGGIDWPAIPGLQSMLVQVATPEPTTPAQAQTATSAEAAPAEAAAPQIQGESAESLVAASQSMTWRDRFMGDPTANSLAVVVLAGMLISLLSVLRPLPKTKKGANPGTTGGYAWLIPVLSVIGLGVAGYLAYVETSQVLAVCGPVGDCNAVQQSEYARLLGIPIAIYGLAGYAGILILWAAQRWVKTPLAQQAGLGIFAIAVIGVLFSIYLTFLEPFVIGATCMWCLTSAVIMTVILLLSTKFRERVKG